VSNLLNTKRIQLVGPPTLKSMLQTIHRLGDHGLALSRGRRCCKSY